ncbi:MAG: glycosyltransferase family 4 protein [Pseudomonadota bacterium]
MTRIATLVKGYPRLSETFIAQEIEGLERRGIEQLIVSLRHPTDALRHPVHDRIQADVLYLPEYLKDDPKRVAKARTWAASQRNFKRLIAMFERDLARDRTVNRWRRLGQALVLAHELPTDITALYVHYLHTPCSVARYASILTDVPFAFSAHAKDIWTSPEWEIREKIADAKWGVTCTSTNVSHLNDLADVRGKVELVYHGLNISDLGEPRTEEPVTPPLRLVSVGRAVEKKGYGDLLSALKKLPKDLDWHLDHIGGGAMLKRLKTRAEKAGLTDRITWHGSKAREDVIRILKESHIFVLPSRIAKSGDRDGLPNVLMEAMAMRLPCIATRVSAIPEIVKDGETGLLVDERSPDQIVDAILKLASDRDRRMQMGETGRNVVSNYFSPDPGLDRLADLIRSIA